MNGKRTGIAKEDLMLKGASIGNKKAKAAIEEINKTVGQWGKFADEVNVSPGLRDEIRRTLIRLE